MTDCSTVAALFVESRGIYAYLKGTDVYGIDRDARKYDGPYSAVAHPPCERWGRMFKGGLRWKMYNNGEGKKLGDDNGCFESALRSVRKYGGVLEHPEGSHAFAYFMLRRPPNDQRWHDSNDGGFVACVDQGHYGHPARKFTWLYAVVKDPSILPALPVGDSGKKGRIMFSDPVDVFRAKKKDDSLFMVEKWQRAATPVLFAELLLNIARNCK